MVRQSYDLTISSNQICQMNNYTDNYGHPGQTLRFYFLTFCMIVPWPWPFDSAWPLGMHDHWILHACFVLILHDCFVLILHDCFVLILHDCLIMHDHWVCMIIALCMTAWMCMTFDLCMTVFHLCITVWWCSDRGISSHHSHTWPKSSNRVWY